MVYFLALLIFAALSGGSWFLAVAAYRSTVSGSDPAETPNYHRIAAVAITLVTLACFVPYPYGMWLSWIVWAIATMGFLAIPASRRLLLFVYLATASILERLAIIGILDRWK